MRMALKQTVFLRNALKKSVGAVRQNNGRSATASFLIIDSQSVKNADTAEQKGYDAGKKISGITRHIAVDTNGLPHAIHMTTANVTDREGALQAFGLHKDMLPDVQNVLADGGYSGKNFAAGVKEILGCPVTIAKRSELHTFKVIPKRWVVERSFTDDYLLLFFKESVSPALRLWCMARKMQKIVEKM